MTPEKAANILRGIRQEIAAIHDNNNNNKSLTPSEKLALRIKIEALDVAFVMLNERELTDD